MLIKKNSKSVAARLSLVIQRDSVRLQRKIHAFSPQFLISGYSAVTAQWDTGFSATVDPLVWQMKTVPLPVLKQKQEEVLK